MRPAGSALLAALPVSLDSNASLEAGWTFQALCKAGGHMSQVRVADSVQLHCFGDLIVDSNLHCELQARLEGAEVQAQY